MEQLRWYLEHFLDYPFDPEIGHANYVLDALQSWGTQAFNALFDRRDADKWLADSEILQIRSDDPHILSWPWEALFDPQRSYLAHERQIERRLNHLPDPPPRRNLPNDCVNILLVVARPFARDVRYRSIARPLVELIRSRNLPAHVDVLRPPTFDQLREHLRAHPGYYHALHFDGHGAYGNGAGEYSRHKLQGPQGSLIFEDAAGDPDPKSARDLSALLHEYAVPAVVLNACQSAMLDSKAGDAFASVATALLQSGMRSVVAMAYSLYVSGAQVFLPAFYRRLFEAGSVAEAVSARRLAAAGALPAGPARLQLRHLGAGKPACRVATPGDATTRPPLRLHRPRRSHSGNGARAAPQGPGDSGARPGRSRQDHPGARLPALARRHRRPRRRAMVRFPRYPEWRIRDQPDGRGVLRRELPARA
jgi:hypothetical protein